MDKYPRIAISAGHGLSSRKPGAFDPGAVAYDRREAVAVYNLAKRIVADLRVLGRYGAEVMFRDAGYFASADDEAAKWGADVFVELHFNAGPATASGVETLHHPASTARLATLIHKRLVPAIGIKDRGVRVREDLAVLRPHQRMAAALVEVAFISSKHDMAYYLENRDDVERAILNGILEYVGWKPVKSLPRKWSWLMKRRWRPY